jgi:hypothetical protein
LVNHLLLARVHCLQVIHRIVDGLSLGRGFARPALARPLRIALVTETYAPEINGVAQTLAHVAEGLRARGHDLQLLRPRQRQRQRGDAPSVDSGTRLLRGMPFEAMQQVDCGLRLVFGGGGPLRETLRARCPQAVFAGERRGDDLAAHYASADLFVFPSLTETYGNFTPEALASGLPVLAFDTPPRRGAVR